MSNTSFFTAPIHAWSLSEGLTFLHMFVPLYYKVQVAGLLGFSSAALVWRIQQGLVRFYFLPQASTM